MNKQLFNAMVAQYGKNTVASTGEPIEWSGGAHCYLPSVKFYGANEQIGTPTPDNPLAVKELSCFYQTNIGTSIIIPNLNGIGNYKDEWDYVSGKGLRNVASIVLDGVSSGKKALSVNLLERTGYYYAAFRIEHQSHHAQYGLIKSTHFVAEWNYLLGTAYVSGSGNYLYRYIFAFNTDQTLDTAAKWNAWLKEQYDAGTPVTFYYALAEPIPFAERPDTYTPIPNDSGKISFGDGTMSAVPFEVSYITHS